MIQIEEAVKLLQDAIKQNTKTESVALLSALGRVLAEDVVALFDQPPFARSPLDGYALKGEDTVGASRENPVSLKVIGKVYAGEAFEGSVGHGEAVRIMTGAPIPKGADTVIKQENTDYGERVVAVYQPSRAYENYCYQGEDYRSGTCLLKQGMCLGAGEIALLAGMGYDSVQVFSLPEVAVIATGDELVLPGESLTPGKIYDSNLYYITARLNELGIRPHIAMHHGDDGSALLEKIRKMAGDIDLVITTGGVSVGQKDIMHEVVENLPANRLFWKVDVKPGSPTIGAVYKDTLLICLSGNPYGAVANFELLVRPVLAKMSHNEALSMKKCQAVMRDDFHKKSGARRFLRGFYKDGEVSLTFGSQASGNMSSMAGCNCFIEIPKEKAGVVAGDRVSVYLL